MIHFTLDLGYIDVVRLMVVGTMTYVACRFANWIWS